MYLPLRLTFIDGYIDDAISISVDVDDHQARGQHAVPVALHTVFRPNNPNEAIIGDPSLADKNLKAEGTLTETKTILGWEVNSRDFIIVLPADKVQMWTEDINSLLQQNRVKFKQLESLIGRINHVGFIIPYARYFLNQLRWL